MNKINIIFIIVFIPAFLFLQGCLENTLLPEPVNHLQAPRLLYPPDDTTDVDIPVTFSWEGSRNIKDYFLQVSIDSLFDSLVYTYHGRTTIVRDVMGLNYQTKYYWRVNAINGYGENKWSTIWSFTIAGKYCTGTPIVEYAGKIYQTLQIDNQCWLRENLDVGIMLHDRDSSKDNGIIEKYCYNDDTTNCNTYGGLYTWNEAMQYITTEGAQGICPIGWHIPTFAEFQVLIFTIGDGNALKATGQGSGKGTGTNTSGFSVLLGGNRGSTGVFSHLRYYAYFWNSTEINPIYAYVIYLHYSDSFISQSSDYGKGNGFSIRCLKD